MKISERQGLHDWDELDRNILYQLDVNCRQSASEIARHLNSNKKKVNGRINRLIKSGVIKRFTTDVNGSALGYHVANVFLKTQNVSEKDNGEFYSYVQSLKGFKSVVRIITSSNGGWDLNFCVQTKEHRGLFDSIQNALSKYNGYIVKREIIHNVHLYRYDRTWLLTNPPRSKPTISGGKKTLDSLDKIDKAILKALMANGRIPIVKIAKRTDQTSQNIINRIKKLEQKHVIIKYSIDIDYEKIGYISCQILIHLQHMTKQALNRQRTSHP